MEKPDRRVVRTQTALAKALIALTLEKGYDAVTIRDIAERANVGYATFFRHYSDKAALLLDVLDVFVAELVALLQARSGDPPSLGQGTLIFRYAQEHQELCRVLLQSQHSAALVQRIRAATRASDQGAATAAASNIEAAIPPEIIAHHTVAASLALIQWWLENGLPYPPEQMGAIYEALITRPVTDRAQAPPKPE